VCGGEPLLDGRYRLDALLGEGGAGVTYRATRLADGLAVCVKELATRRMASFEDEKLFEREADVLRQLHHPQIPSYLDSFVAGVGKHRARYLVQELVIGRDLARELADHRYTEREVLAVLDELLEVLTYLGDLRPPVVHRDVKPSNVMRRADDGRLVLVDFGAVKDAVEHSLGGATIAGTLGYMAPEQLYGQADTRSDLYGAGATALALLSRRDLAEFFERERGLAWRGRVTMSPGTERVLAALLAPSPDDRPPSARAARALVAEARAALDEGASESARSGEHGNDARGTGRPDDDAGVLRAAETNEPLAPDDEVYVLGVRQPGGELLGDGYGDGGASLKVWFGVAGVVVAVLLGVLAVLPPEAPAPAVRLERQKRATAAELCDGPCKPLTEPFKAKLRFGMTVAEARAARKEVADAEVKQGDDVVAFGTDRGLPVVNQGVGRAAAPGSVLETKMAVAGYPAGCMLWFYGPGETLSGLMCKLDGFQRRDEYTRALDRIRHGLEKRYGAPSDGGGDRGDEMYVGLAETKDTFRWERGGDSLVLEGEFSDLVPGLSTTTITVKQTTAVHERAVSAAHDRAEADLRRRQAAREREAARERAEEAARLKALSGDEEL